LEEKFVLLKEFFSIPKGIGYQNPQGNPVRHNRLMSLNQKCAYLKSSARVTHVATAISTQRKSACAAEQPKHPADKRTERDSLISRKMTPEAGLRNTAFLK